MKYGNEFKEEIKGEEYHKPEKNTPHKLSNNPDKKTLRKDKKAGRAGEMKKVMAGKMDKFGVNMECSTCGRKGHQSKDCSY